jgi:cytochrome c biogenesis protein CcmG/thiol:disulfide interchange protein DsbE
MPNHANQENLIASNQRPKQQKFSFDLAILLPASIFFGIVGLLAIGLTMDPRKVPSPLIDKPVPEFELAPVQGRQLGLASNDLKSEVSLVNVFASWCVACRQEHPLLLELSRQNFVPIHGLNYKDEADDAAGWLDALGDPYTRTGADLNGRVGIDWGVYGVPETFVIDKNGNIAYKHIGPISQQDWETKIHPLVVDLQSR